MPAIIYTHLKSKQDKTEELFKESELVSLPMLRNKPECRMEAQIVHVKKGTNVVLSKPGSEKFKRIARTYDRLIFLRSFL
jgi:hypothetical protein